MPINPHNPFRAGPFGEVLAVVDTTGALTQYDSAGAHLLFGSGVQSVGLAFGPFGEVLEVVGATGTLTQYDSAYACALFGIDGCEQRHVKLKNGDRLRGGLRSIYAMVSGFQDQDRCYFLALSYARADLKSGCRRRVQDSAPIRCLQIKKGKNEKHICWKPQSWGDGRDASLHVREL